MDLVILTAIGVGGATIFGAIIGFIFKDISHKFSDIVLAFAAGIMLAAAVMGLIIPSLEYGGNLKLLYTIGGIFTGVICLTFIDKLVPHMHRLAGNELEDHKKSNLSRVILFVFAIGIHNLPEGIAAGVGFGSGNTNQALMIALGIALQNIPEGMILISPMINAGIPKGKAFFIALITGLVEVAGTFIGYFAVSIATAILPFALAFAGGTMLYVVSDEMVIETHGHKSERAATFSLILGFCVMLVMDVLLA